MGRDSITGLAVLAVSLVLLWATLGLERHPMVPVGPAFYPRIVLGLTAGMGLLLLVLDVLGRRKAPSVPEKPAAGKRPNHGLVAIAFGIFTAYVLLLPYLGFRIATFAFLVAMQPALERPRGVRAWIVVLLVAVVSSAACYYAFERYLHVLLPRGLWTDF